MAGSETDMRSSGIDLVEDVPWGTHLCQFYKTKEDMLDILVPYMKAGLENNEFCMWVTSHPLDPDDATSALREAIPGFDRYLEGGQIEVLPHDEWYLKGGSFDLNRVFDGWIGKLDGALARGLDGLRATGNTAWLETDNWADFTEYEERLNDIIGGYRMMAICTYSLDRCDSSEIIDVVINHQFALIKREGEWELIESSERRKTIDALRLSEERYRRIVETATEGIWIIDSENRMSFVNQRLAEMLDYSPEDMIGMPIFAFMDGESQTSAKPYLENLARGMGDKFDFRFRSKAGTDLWTIMSTSPIVDEDRNYVGALGMVTDITDRKKAEAEILRANEELIAYGHTVSHDLRNPLSAVLLANENLRHVLNEPDLELTRPDMQELTTVINRNLEKSYELIADLLALAEAGQKPSEVSPVSISDVVARVLEERTGELGARGIRVQATQDLGAVVGNNTQMYQLFSNLIGNAIRHNDAAEPVIEVSYLGDAADGAHRYLVRDNGSGIPAADMDKMFTAFYKRGTTSDTGIGLAIVDKVVKVYGGKIQPYNDEGACFEFSVKDWPPESVSE